MVKSARSSHRILRNARDSSRRREIFFGNFRSASDSEYESQENPTPTAIQIELHGDGEDKPVAQKWS